MADLQEFYKNAREKGVIDQSVDYASFEQAMRDERQRQDFYQYATNEGLRIGTPERFDEYISSRLPQSAPQEAGGVSGGSLLSEQEELARQNAYQGVTNDPNHPFVEKRPSFWQSIGGHNPYPISATTDIQGRSRQQQQEAAAQDAARAQSEWENMLAPYKEQFEAQWKQDAPVLDEVWNKANERAKAAAESVQRNKPQQVNLPSAMGGGFGNIGYSLMASREANKQNSPEAIIEAFERELDNKYQSKDVKGDIQLAKEMGATTDEYQLYKRFVEDKIAERFVGQNIPQDKLDYFARKFIQGNLIAQLASLYTQSPQTRQYAMQGTQQYEQANPGWATKGVAIGAEVANVVADPLMWIMPGVGEAAGRGIVNAAGRRLASVGLSDAAGAAERAAMQRGLLRTAQRLTSGGVMMAGIDTGHTLVGDLYQTGDVNWSNLATAPIRGALTGMAFAGGGALGERVQKAVGDVFGRDLGLVAGRATHFATGTNIMVGSSVASHILQGGSPDDIDWGIEYANAAAMQLFFDIQGGLKTASKAKGFGNAWKAMRQDPMAHTLTREEIEQFNAVGIEGNDAYTILKNLNGGKEFTSLEEYYKVLNDISADERIDTQAKYKLASLLYGKVDAHVSPIYVGDVEAVADGYVVKTYDNGGMTYETRKFDTQRAADVYRARQHDATRNNMLEWVEGIIRTRGFAEKMQEVTDGAIDKTKENYPQLSREDAYRVLSADEGSLTPIERAIRGQMEKYLAEDIKGSDILKDVREQVAREQGVSIDDLSKLLSQEYSRLSAKDKTVFENYLDRLNEYMPRNNDRTERRAIGEGGGLGPNPPEETTPLSPAAAEYRRAVDEVTQSVRERTHGNGYIYSVSMPGKEGLMGNIVGDVVPVIDESNPEQLQIENDDIVTVKWSDGTVTQERARDLDLIGDPMPANEVIDADVENRMYDYTQQRIQNGEQPVLMRNSEGVLEGFFPTEGGLLEDQNGVQYTLEQLAEQGWQETKPVLFVNDTQQIAALDNGDGTYTQVDALGNPIAEPMNAEAFREQGFAMVPLEEEQPKSQAPVEAPVVQQAPVEQAPEVQAPAAPVVPNIETMSADELGGSAVEYMGDRASAMAYLEAERDKADAEVQRTSKLKVTRFNGPEDFKRQNDQIQAAKRAAIDRYNKLQNAITAANAYKTLAEQKEEAERKAREAELREQRRQLAEAESAGDIEAKWQNTKKTVGFAATKTLPNGQKVNGHYILTEAGDVVPSHDPRKNYADSEGYVMENGQNVNDNNYKDPDVQKIANDIAQNYGGQAVEQMPFLENKAGRVLSGNNRTISGIIAAENNTDQAYLAALAENAQQYGFTPEQLAEYQHPRLQFVVEDELPFTTGTFAMFNQQEKKTKSSVNRAIANSKMVTEAVRDKMLEVMDQYDSLDSFFGSENAAADIVQSLISEGLMTQQEVAGLTESTGTGFKFSQSGREYVTDMLLGTLFDEQTIKMLAGEKTLKQAILRALPSIVENRRLKGYELTESINKAVQILYEARKANEGKSTADAFQLFLRQVDAFQGKVTDRFDGFDIILANRMSAGVEQLREMLNLYNNSARDEANGQMGFFEPRSSEDIKQDVYEYYTKQQPDLAAALNGAAEEGSQSQSPVSSGTANAGEVRPTQREKLTEYLNGIADEEHKPILFDNSTLVETLRNIGATPDAIAEAQSLVVNGGHIEGFYLNGYVCLNIDNLPDAERARTKYVHERQHDLTRKDIKRVKEVMNVASESELKSLLEKFSNSPFYNKQKHSIVADEFISFAMEEAYKAKDDAELESALRAFGVKDELIDIIKSINNEQRGIEAFAMARRNAPDNHSAESSSRESSADSGTQSEGGLGREGFDTDQQSLRRTEGGGDGVPASGEVSSTKFEDTETGKRLAEVKRQYPEHMTIVRAGDEYHVYGEDAINAGKALGLDVTQRDGVPFVSFPFNQLDAALPKLVRSGHKCVIASYIEPAKPKEEDEHIFHVGEHVLYDGDEAVIEKFQGGDAMITVNDHQEYVSLDELRKIKAADTEIGGALVDRLEDMGLSVSTDLQANRDALKAAKADKSEAGAIHYYKTPSGQQYGFSYKGKVYLDPTKINAELPLHEYGHLWAEALRRLNSENWQHVVDTIKADKDAWEFVKSLRPELTDENEIAEEVIATFSGKKGAERLKAEYERMHGKDADYKSKWGNIFKNISKAIQDFWKAVGDFLNIKYESAEQVYDQVLKDFVDNMNPWKRVSDFLRQRDAEYVQAAESGDIKTATNIFYDALKENIGNGITPYMSVGTYNNLKRLAKGVKTRDAALIKEAADLIAPLIPDNAVLIPAPSHSGTATDMLDLAKAIAEVTGSEVADVLRSAPRESQYQAKKTTGVPMASKQLGIAVEGEIPADKTPIIIDNVVDSGNTAEACVQAVGKGVVVTLADSAEQYGHAASLKSAAPVLRDKDGKVIPLSKRFDLSGSRYLGRRMYLRPDDLRLSVSGTHTIPVGKNTLVGLHNISAEKLRKALKMGGLANPSAAVIDLAKQDHHNYGDISLVMPSSLVDSETGRNAGTYAGDAYTPTYPGVEFHAGKDTNKRIAALTKGLPKVLDDAIQRHIRDYMDGNTYNSGLEYLFLKERGQELPIEHTPRRYPYITIEEIYKRLGMEYPGYYDSSSYAKYEAIPEDQLAEFNLWLQNAGNQEEIDKRKANIARMRSEGKDNFANTLESKWKERMSFANYDSTLYRIVNDGSHAGEENPGMTLDKAKDLVETQGLRPEFEEWMQAKIDDLGYTEVLFDGWTPSGNRRLLPNTLENASKIMNRQDQTNYREGVSVSETKSMLMDKFRTLAQIRKHKDILEPDEEKIKEAYEAVSDDWLQLGVDFRDYTKADGHAYGLADNPFTAIDTALYRIQEAMFKRDPIAWLNKEYRYSIPADNEWLGRIMDLKQRITNLPARYFETKFRRPVYLNEFANAVVPNDLPQDLRDGLEKAGLTLFEYDPKEEGARRAATLQATDGEGIRFSVSGGLSTDRTLTKAAREEMQQIKDAALADGTFMKAPNGKRSNLNERQWLQVRLRSFKRWFGDWENDPQNASKILDENGEPMVVYHRTNNKFTQFDPDRAREQSGWPTADFGFYFSNVNERGHYGRKSMPVFLNIRNPREIDVDYYADFDYNYKHADPEEMRKDNDGLQINIGRLILDEKATKVFVTPNPNQIKSATNNNGDFSEENDDIRFSISNQNNDIFYSNAERAVEGIKQEKATPEQWRAMIEKAGGLKAGEDKWIGLSDWLAQQRPTVTPQEGETRSQFVERAAAENKRFTLSKQELLDYIREHKIQIEEVEYDENEYDVLYLNRKKEFKRYYDEAVDAGEEEPQDVAWQRMIDEYGDDFELAYWAQGDELMRDNDSDYAQWEDDAEGYPRNINETRLEYTTKGLDNKREIALTVPTIESWNETDEIHFGDAGEGRAIAWVRFGDATATERDADLTRKGAALRDFEEEMQDKYNSAGEELLAMFSPEEREQYDKLNSDVEKSRREYKVLVIDEIQSKRHQEGREKGYKATPTEEEYKEIIRREKVANSLRGDKYDFEREMKVKYGSFDFEDIFKSQMTDAERDEWRQYDHDVDEAEAELHELKDRFPYDPSTPPVAPFEKNWHELAMKRILRFAAENGYDKVAWTTGDQQAARYNIGEVIDSITRNEDEDYPYSYSVMSKDHGELEYDFDENGIYHDDGDPELDGKSMSDVFGKELAKRLQEMPAGETIDNEGLRIGGEGMRGFYDDILPRFMQKYGKKWGVQVGEVTMPQLEEGYQTMHAIDINDAMRESVMEGQPMFSISGRGVNGTMKPQEGETRSQYIARVAETVKNMTPRNTTIDDAIRFSITVNHNSPYLLKRADGAFVDPETGERLGFDHRFMGKGEGGQAHGWGSYFSVNDLRGYAENHLVMGDSEEAKEEEERIYSAFDIPGLNKTPYFGIFDDPRSTIFRIVSAVNENKQRPQSLKLWLEDKLKESKEIISSIPTYRQASGEDWYKKREAEFDEMFIPVLLKYMKHDLDMRNRHHYSVEIPDNDGTNYLEETEPMNERARKAIADGLVSDGYQMEEKSNDEFSWLEFRKGDSSADPDNQIGLNEDATYRDFIHDNFHGYDSKMLPRISEYLSKAGIVGIHYDGRRDGECYVIFNPDDAVITDHIRFSVTGSRGAANIDKMEGVTTRMDNLAAARQMEEDGKDAKTIRMATGWERGADGKWRYEIDDVQLNADNVKANFRKLDRRGVTAPMVWYHNKFTDIIADSPERKQLLAAYPQLADLDIEFYDYPNKERGAYSSEKKKISINRANVRSMDECRSVLLHEIQHAIQEAELFAKGTSKEQIQLTWKLNNEVHNKVDEYFDKMGFKEWLTSHNGDKAFVDRLMQVIHMFPNRDFNIHYLFVETLPRDKQIDAIDVLGDANDVIQSNRDAIYGADRKGMTMNADELYHNAAGEVESRNVQNRMNLTPEERRERLLEETEDVAREDQVVIMNAFDMANDEVPQTTNRATSNYQSRNSIVTEALVKQANDSFRLMQSALRKVSADLRTINAIRTQQFEYDRKVVDMLLDLYNSLLQENSVWAGYMPDTTRRIATQIVHAIGKKDISAEVNTIMDHMVHAQAKAAQRQWDKLRTTPVDKINISGVVMQGKVALQGQHALKAMNEALDSKATIEQLEDQIAQLMDMEDNATDESLKLQYKGQWIGYTIAAQHLERIQHLVDERNQLDIELQAARSNRAIKQSARQQLVANIQQAMRDNYIAQADAYAQSAKDLAEYVTTQEEQAKDFIHRQDANRDKIRSYAQRDLEGLATNPNRNRTRGNIARQIWDAFSSPIRDLQSLLRLTGLHAPDGEGYLYNHFMRGWMDGADKERLGIVNASKTLDAKINELTHGKYKTWEEAARKINDASHNMFTITMLNGVDGKDMPVTEEIPLNAGNALYIYAVNKMNDGRMKLNGMNITEEDVQALADKVREQFGQEILDVVDWVQSEFFSQLRNRYNPTHEALFGAPMDAIENYFPLRINANARQQNEDLSEPDTDAARLLAGTSTGAIKRRTRNSLPLDVRNADFFQEVIRHISQMERWNAFAQWNRDANILFSDINFRNRIKGMNGTIYGSGDKLYNYMKDAFRVAIGTYKPKTDTFSEITLNVAKGVTSAKINFRIFTALKQIASFPAFFTYMQDGVFVGSYLRNWLKPHETMKWAKENLPNFEKRVSKRDMGDMRLMQRSTDWQWNKRILEWSSKYGMFFNVFFDTLTCATGARAVYDSRYAEYIKKGYSLEQAEQRARQDAEQAFNTSQQSSEGAFMSAVQMDRNLVTAALTVFRTSPIQYTRNFMFHTRNLLRKFGRGSKDEQIAFRMGQYKNDGLSEEQARKAAEKDYNKSIRADVVGFVVYGALLNLLWRLVGQVPYLLFGDDDDKKKQILDEATSGGAWFSPFTGLLGGGIVESALDGNGSVADMFAPEMPFTQDVKRAGQYLENNKYAEFANQALSVAMQSGTGFDPQTAADVIQRIVTTLDSEEELDAATKAIQISFAIASIPQSQYEQQLVDRVVAAEREYEQQLIDREVADKIENAALADYIRYQKVHTAPLTWWMRGDESDEKAEENAERRFDRLLDERDELHSPEEE